MNWSKEWKTPEPPSIDQSLRKLAVDLASGNEATNATYEFRDGHKTRRINVIIVGDLGLDFDDNGWNIYHIPTLSCFSKAVPGYALHDVNDNHTVIYQSESNSTNEDWLFNYNRDQLLSWMKKVQDCPDKCFEISRGRAVTGRVLRNSWSDLRLLTPENFKDKGESAKQIILDWCLSVRVE